MNPYDIFDKIYCINLDSRPDRMELAWKEFEQAGIKERVERIPGTIVPENPCYGNHLSHAFCLQRAKKSGAGNCLIFEDDIEWLNDPLDFKKTAPELKCLDWDLLYLGVNTEKDCFQVTRHLAKLTFAYSTHAYAINNSLFDVLIALNTDPLTIHNDVKMTESIIPHYNCYANIPLLAGQRTSYSDIMGKVMSSNSVFLERFSDHLIRKTYPDTEPTFVTFITPTLGRSTLKRTMDSIVGQRSWNWKHIVMFDGVDPNITSDDSHVTIVRTETRGGAGSARNKALKYVTTDWVAFVDDDDWIDLDYVEAIQRHSGNTDVIIFTYKDVTNGNMQPPHNINTIVAGNVGISFAVRTDFIIKNNIEFYPGGMEDFVFLDACQRAGAKISFTHEVKYWVGGRGCWQ
jgi:hypothetical protein